MKIIVKSTRTQNYFLPHCGFESYFLFNTPISMLTLIQELIGSILYFMELVTLSGQVQNRDMIFLTILKKPWIIMLGFYFLEISNNKTKISVSQLWWFLSFHRRVFFIKRGLRIHPYSMSPFHDGSVIIVGTNNLSTWKDSFILQESRLSQKSKHQMFWTK